MSTPAPRPSRRRPAAQQGLVRSFLDLGAAQQRTAAAALVVLVSLGAPWYSTEVAFPATAGRPASVVEGTITGISAFSFVEAAVVLVAGAVLALVWARATRRTFSLPAGDGTIVTGAAAWLGLLIVYRLFDRPEGGTDGATATLVGLSWGVFATLAAVGLLLATGLDQRRRDAERRAAAPHVPDGPVVDPADVVPVTDRPAWDGPAPDDDDDAPTRVARPAWSRDGEPAPIDPAASHPDPARAPQPRSWAFDDPDAPEPAPPRSAPSRRRPTPPEAPTTALPRAASDDRRGATDAGADTTGHGFRPAPTGPGRAAGFTAQDDPTRVVGARPADDRETPRIVSWDGADDPTRALPPAAERDAAPDTDVTRRHDVPPTEDGDGRPRRGLRRRR